ncbi:hypothetical protein LZZ85_13665 [Terrimonas sp. NA20]|uniref:Uncharacterized protein n=1 Tax=Terrimonas ginsenosidimutans TaxID=2908004 RepID=A0ABS9KSN5_9BACT|nr:hypothetical protein [Terrimonas ginsenosidimutans]MCG2615342.1 hypothetical protein [Terrimonas ginsenosidimutans]
MQAILHISPSKYVYELQQEFSSIFPHLRLEFYRRPGNEAAAAAKQLIPKTMLFRDLGVMETAAVESGDEITVAVLEGFFLKKFGILAQVVRQSGTVWLETTMTDDWTLFQQNEHGRELSGGFHLSKDPAQEILSKHKWCDQ